MTEAEEDLVAYLWDENKATVAFYVFAAAMVTLQDHTLWVACLMEQQVREALIPRLNSVSCTHTSQRSL